MDGVDALCARIEGNGFEVRVTPLAFACVPYPDSVRADLIRAPALPLVDVTRLNLQLGELFARAASEAAGEAGLVTSDIDLIGSHGQTVCHLPDKNAGRGASTLQIGDLDVIAERTGAVVVGDFRARDVAAGGAGAPLSPYLDWVLFRHRPRTVCVNIGGISNLSLVTEELENCRAFDVGPGNLPLDLVTHRLTNGAENYDPGGRFAEDGIVDAILLERLMGHPFVTAPPPKTTGREEFGATFTDDLLRRHHHLRLQDILATLTAFVARAIQSAIADHLTIEDGVREIIVSGGGVHNLTLMRHLKKGLFPVPVTISSDHDLDPDAKEGMLFALLANERIFGNASNVPLATGARWPVCLGKIAL